MTKIFMGDYKDFEANKVEIDWVQVDNGVHAFAIDGRTFYGFSEPKFKATMEVVPRYEVKVDHDSLMEVLEQ